MYRRTIQWNRPNADAVWPWENSSYVDDYNDLLATATGYIGKFNISNTETEIINNNDWATKEDWQAVADNPITIALINSQEALMLSNGVTKTITESVIEV